MNTSVSYSVVPRTNPAKPQLPVRYYAMAQARGVADVRSLSDRINSMCTVNPTDVMGVLVALETVVKDCLANGEIVRLGELGSLQMSLSSKGVIAKEDFNASLINKSRILFRPGETLSAMQKNLSFARVAQLPKSKKGSAEGPDSSATDEPGSAGTEDTGEVLP